ncbi:MAG: hypothetical protein WBB74_04265 [Gaiellaceae bacterium]
MEFEIRPEPKPEEREAIVVALQRLLERAPAPPAYRSRWRQAGLVEGVEADYTTAPLRKTSGETRT